MFFNRIREFFQTDRSPRFIIIFLLLLFCGTNFIHRHWIRDEGPQRGVIKWDVISYYSYLPATFIYKDLSLEFSKDPDFNNDNKFWSQKTESGKNVIITSMGLSYLYSPFFFMAHILAPVLNETRDGFSSIYQFFLVLSGLVYVGFGLFFLWKFLARYFRSEVVSITLLLIGLGTNFYYYSTYEAAMSHSYNFSLISLFLFLSARWYDRANLKNSVLLGLVYGLIVLIRPTNLLIIIVFLGLGVDSVQGLMARLNFLIKKIPVILIMILAFVLPWIPQFIYWHGVSGSIMYNSYSEVGSSFYFDNPHIIDFLFSYQKGWFVYTPMMLFAVAGFYFLYRNHRSLFFAPAIYLPVMIYVFSSWWSWWTGGSFGIRSMVDLMPVMSIPLAALISQSKSFKPEFKWGMAVVLIFVIYLNLFQSWQYHKVLIHWAGMTKESYWTIFLSSKDKYGYWQNIKEADGELARKGIYIYYPVIGKDERLMAMSEEEGKDYVQYNIRKDRRLVKDIKRYARRNEIKSTEALEMVVDRAYRQLTK